MNQEHLVDTSGCSLADGEVLVRAQALDSTQMNGHLSSNASSVSHSTNPISSLENCSSVLRTGQEQLSIVAISRVKLAKNSSQGVSAGDSYHHSSSHHHCQIQPFYKTKIIYLSIRII